MHVFYCTQWSYSLNQQQNYMAIYNAHYCTEYTDKKFGNHEHYCVHVFYCTGVIVYKPAANYNYKLQ